MFGQIISFAIASSFLVTFEHTDCPHLLSITGGGNVVLSKNGSSVSVLQINNNSNWNVHMIDVHNFSTFQWPELLIDGVKMISVEGEGTVSLHLNNIKFLCPISQFEGGITPVKKQTMQKRHYDSLYAIICLPLLVVILSFFMGLKLDYSDFMHIFNVYKRVNKETTV